MTQFAVDLMALAGVVAFAALIFGLIWLVGYSLDVIEDRRSELEPALKALRRWWER